MKNEDLLRDEINQLIRAEIQEGINDYVDQLEVVEKGGLGFVGKDEENELKVKVPVSEVDKIKKSIKRLRRKKDLISHR